MTVPTLLKPFQPRTFLLTLRGIFLLSPWILHLLGADVILSLLLPVSFVLPTAAYQISSKIAYGVWYGIQRIFTKWNKARITTSGAELPRNESAVVVANHLSWTDFYLIQEMALRSNMLGSCRWFAKKQLKWVPFLGWGLWAMGMPLIARNWDKDRRELQRVFRGRKSTNGPCVSRSKSYGVGTKLNARAYQLFGSNQIHAPEVSRDCTVVQINGQASPAFYFVSTDKRLCDHHQELGTESSVTAVYDLTLAYAHEGRFMEAPEMWQTVLRKRHGQRLEIPCAC